MPKRLLWVLPIIGATLVIVIFFRSGFHFLNARPQMDSGREINTSPSPKPTQTEVTTGKKSLTASPAVHSVPSKSLGRGSTPNPTQVVNPTQRPQQYGAIDVHVYRDDGQAAVLSSFQLYYPNGTVQTYYPDNNGYIKVTSLPPGNYRMVVHYGSNTTEKTILVQANETQKVNVTVSSAPPTPTPTPTPVPDTQPPVLDGVNGPYDWGQSGICFTINANQVHDNQLPYTFSFSWGMDASWSDWKENEATKCYQNLSSGSHELSAKIRDLAGNVSNLVPVTFTH